MKAKHDLASRRERSEKGAHGLSRVVALFAVLSLVLVSCGGDAEPDERPTASFGVLRAPTGALGVVAGDQGCFEDVEVEFVSFAEGGGPAIIQAMAGGTPDIALLNLATTVLALGQGTFDVQIVSVASDPGSALPLLATADITSVEDLRGRRVSVPQGGGQFYLLASILNKFGMTYDDIDYQPLPIGEAQAAFLSGQLDAVISSVNGTVLIQQNAPDTNLLFDPGTDFDPEDAYFSPDVLIATRDAVENRPEALAAFVRGYNDCGVEYLNDAGTRDGAIEEIQEYMENVGAGVEDLEAVEVAIDSLVFYSVDESRDLLTSDSFKAAIDRQVQFWIDGDVFTEAPDIDSALNTSIIGE